MKVTVNGNALVLTSDIKAKEIELLKKVNPSALKLKDEDGNDIFAIGLSANGGINKNGVSFDGKTRQFKVFTVEGNKVTSEILDSGEYSHGSLATLLAESGVTTLICGGIGDGARNMLNSNGIDVYTGNSGNADEVAAAFIAGTLSKSSKSTCQDHHDCHCH